MLHLMRFASLRLLAIGAIAAWTFSIQTSAVQAQATDINSALNDLAGFKATKMQIAPMVKKGSPQRGDWTNATPVTYFDGTTSGSLWGSILNRSGIVFGNETPKLLQEEHHAGFLEYIGDSQVILPGGTRATYGWFVKMEGESGATKDFFILMSYDLKPNFSGPSQAFEVFVFTAGHSIFDNTQFSTLVGGFAVQLNGTLLKEVPLGIADQRFNSNPGVAVTPGVVSDGNGCLACHSHNLDDLPQSSTPFPWLSSFYETTPPTAPSAVPQTPSTALPGGVSGGDTKTTDTKTTDAQPTDTKPTDTKPTDTKATDAKTPTTPVKDDKLREADTAKLQQTEKSVTSKDEKPSKATMERLNPKSTKHLTDIKTATASKTVKQTKDKPTKDKTEVHIEFFSTRGGGGGFGTGGFGR